jgi:NAD(P)-dependent dehydrogenase (short-subunit alcohol dehydrogenase family)
VHFAREGADVAVVYLDEHKDADETVALVEKEGQKALKFAGDVGKPEVGTRLAAGNADVQRRLLLGKLKASTVVATLGCMMPKGNTALHVLKPGQRKARACFKPLGAPACLAACRSVRLPACLPADRQGRG